MIYKLLTLLLVPTNIIFASVVLNTNNNHNIEFNNTNNYTLNVKINTGEVLLTEITRNNTNFIRLNIEKGYSSKIIGNPELPQFNQLIAIPLNSTPRIEIIKQNETIFDLNEYFIDTKIYPVQPSRSKSLGNNNFIFNQDVYNMDILLNTNLVEIDNKGKMREVEIGNLLVKPFKYNAKTNQLIIYNDIEMNIHFDNADIDLTKQIKDRYFSPYFEPIFEKNLINYNSLFNTRENNFIEEPRKRQRID